MCVFRQQITNLIKNGKTKISQFLKDNELLSSTGSNIKAPTLALIATGESKPGHVGGFTIAQH
jgi:hypothetical protein